MIFSLEEILQFLTGCILYFLISKMTEDSEYPLLYKFIIATIVVIAFVFVDILIKIK